MSGIFFDPQVQDSGNNVTAEYAYDALGRRIRKVDAVAAVTTLYYYDPDWRCLEEYEGGTLDRLYVYGNYIDEVVLSGGTAGAYYTLHDHLHSAVALLDTGTGAVLERYEYDAYGTVHVFDGSWNTRTTSAYGNPYTFTGRRLDSLDNGNLEIMYYRYRTYDPYVGRFLQYDPVGIILDPGERDHFRPTDQYEDGVHLYNGHFAMHGQVDPMGTSMSLSELAKKALKGATLIRVTACIPCGFGTLGIQGMCAAARGVCGEDLDINECICEVIESNTAWKVACNVCLSPLSWFTDIKKFYGCN